MTVVYLVIITQQDGQPAAWFVAGLTMAGLLCIYGTVRAAVGRRWVLGVAAVLLLGLGLLGILTIGLPILVAGVLAGVAATRAWGSLAAPPAAG